MKFTYTRSIDPMKMDCQLSLDDADLNSAFTAQADPNEDLFYNVMGPGWTTQSVPEQLRLLADVTELAIQAASLQTQQTGDPQPK